MFPLYDSTPRRTVPFVNYAIIVLTIIVFFWEITYPDQDAFINKYAFFPNRFDFFNLSSYFQIFSSIFLHAGFLHIFTNLWFLRIFGDNVEDRLGHFKYLLFYLLAGFFATMGQYIFAPNANIPMLGASGAISGVAGAYFVFFRNSTVKTLIPIFILPAIVDLSIGFFLGYWFIIQLFSGIGSLVDINGGGVAFFAHVAGFIFGYLYAKTFKTELSGAEVGEIIS